MVVRIGSRLSFIICTYSTVYNFLVEYFTIIGFLFPFLVYLASHGLPGLDFSVWGFAGVWPGKWSL